MKALRTDRWLRILLAMAAMLFLLVLPRYPIGVYNDDGAYILAAKSLLQGSYAQLNLPGQPPFTLYPPGFPLLLAPFTLILLVGPVDYLKAVPLLLTLGSVILLWILFKRRLSQSFLIALIALYAFNPITAAFSGLLMSEPCFIFALLGLFIWMEKVPENRLSPWILGALLGWTGLIRTDGIVIIPAVALGLFMARRWRTLAIAVPVGLLSVGLFYLRNALVSESATVYQGGWELMLREVQREGIGILGKNAWEVLSTLGIQNFVSSQIAVRDVPWGLTLGLLILLTGLVAIGLRAFFEEKRDSTGMLTAFATFCALYFGIHLVWLAVEVRYGMPLVPFLLACAVKSAEYCIRHRPRMRGGLILLFVSLLGFYGVENARAISRAWLYGERTHPAETYRWIAQHLPDNALILTSGPAVVHLYTGKFTTLEAPARDAEDFRYGLLQRGVRYILLRPLDFYPMGLRGQDPNAVWGRRQRWIGTSPGAYRQIYSNATEGREIFEVVEDAPFTQAYTLYLSATEAFNRGLWQKGFAFLDQASRQDPHLINAYNAYGVGALLSGTRIEEGIRRLRKALKLSPDHALLLLNLARLEKRSGDPAAAAHFAMARQAIERTGEYTSLLPVIQQESSR
jgi:hypothetical protein